MGIRLFEAHWKTTCSASEQPDPALSVSVGHHQDISSPCSLIPTHHAVPYWPSNHWRSNICLEIECYINVILWGESNSNCPWSWIMGLSKDGSTDYLCRANVWERAKPACIHSLPHTHICSPPLAAIWTYRCPGKLSLLHPLSSFPVTVQWTFLLYSSSVFIFQKFAFKSNSHI